MRRLTILCALAFATAPATAQAPPAQQPRHAGVLRTDTPDGLREVIPPQRYQGDVAVVTVFSRQAIIEQCGAEAIVACAKTYTNGTVILFVPNPCVLAGKELYATILCHEIGHVSGWPATHGD